MLAEKVSLVTKETITTIYCNTAKTLSDIETSKQKPTPCVSSPSHSRTTGRVPNHTTHVATLMNRTWMPALIYANQSQTKSSAGWKLKIMLMWGEEHKVYLEKPRVDCGDWNAFVMQVIATFHAIWFTFEVSLIKIIIFTWLSLFYVQKEETLWKKMTVDCFKLHEVQVNYSEVYTRLFRIHTILNSEEGNQH